MIERTKHKYRRYTRFFSNEAVLKQQNCKPQIKKEKCPHCSKTINRANNLKKHLRSSEKAPAHPSKQQLRQTTLDGPTSLENGLSTPKKLLMEEVQVGGALAEHPEHWKAPQNSRVCLKVHGSRLQEGIQQQQQKRHPAATERGYPLYDTRHRRTNSS